MSIEYTPQPINKIKYKELKSDILSSRIPGLVIEESAKGKPGYDSFDIIDGKGNTATVYKSDNGSVGVTFFNVTDNIPWLILHKLSRHYGCEMVDEEGAGGNASDFLSLWQEELPKKMIPTEHIGGRYGKPVKGSYKKRSPTKKSTRKTNYVGFKMV